MVEFKSSETKTNLMRAFAGESQARNRYTIAAARAKEQNLPVIHDLFVYTAKQELEHAEIFYDFLKQMTGEKLTISADYPVDNYESIEKLLRAAQHGEEEEHDVIYMNFSKKATEEGFEQIATAFKQIALIEKSHAERFKKFADMMENNALFSSETETIWICQNCGHIQESKSAPEKCPVCSAAQGWFLRKSMSPYGTHEL